MFSSQNSQVSQDAVFIEDVFSTYLYTGNGTSQTITNGIDLAGKGGLVWIKSRSDATSHALYDSARGATKELASNSTGSENTESTGLTSFNSSGFSLGPLARLNTNAATYAAWSFRKQPKFFDCVTYTGNGVAGRTVAHSLGSVPGCIIVKNTSSGSWGVYHRSMTAPAQNYYMLLNTTAANVSSSIYWNNTAPTSTEFTVGSGANVNFDGDTYVAYLFAHDAGGFGLTGTDNVISCGSYTGNGSATGPVINLGWEPQWLIVKRSAAPSGSGTAGWVISDNMRGLSQTQDGVLSADTSGAETAGSVFVQANATGFQIATTNPNWNTSGDTYIYIAIRRGPMKVPTTGTSVFAPVATSGTYSSPVTLSTGFPVDAIFSKSRGLLSGYGYLPVDRLRGSSAGTTPYLNTPTTNAEVTNSAGFNIANNTGATDAGFWTGAPSGGIDYLMFRRAPGFFDEVCFGATGQTNPAVNHNLQVPPELIIHKPRSNASQWTVAHSYDFTKNIVLNTANAAVNYQFATNINSQTVNINFGGLGSENWTKVIYLFASAPGVSKVGSYTGTGTTLQINCGFTGGARFVLIKRTDSTGDWYVWDSARGIVSGNDPYLLLNSTAAEVTNTDYVDTYSAGFEISSTAPAAINASGGTFIFLAIA